MADRLTGGTGDDVFALTTYQSRPDSIADFSASGDDDSLALMGNVFGNHAAGGLLASEFQSSNASVAVRATVRFLYDRDDHSLYYDVDGSGTQSAVLLVVFQPGALVTAADLSFF